MESKLQESDLGNTEHEVNIGIAEDWLKELEVEFERLTRFLCPSRLKVILGRLACKVHMDKGQPVSGRQTE